MAKTEATEAKASGQPVLRGPASAEQILGCRIGQVHPKFVDLAESQARRASRPPGSGQSAQARSVAN